MPIYAPWESLRADRIPSWSDLSSTPSCSIVGRTTPCCIQEASREYVGLPAGASWWCPWWCLRHQTASNQCTHNWMCDVYKHPWIKEINRETDGQIWTNMDRYGQYALSISQSMDMLHVHVVPFVPQLVMVPWCWCHDFLLPWICSERQAPSVAQYVAIFWWHRRQVNRYFLDKRRTTMRDFTPFGPFGMAELLLDNATTDTIFCNSLHFDTVRSQQKSRTWPLGIPWWYL